MGVNIVQKRDGTKIVDLTGATLSSSDGSKILIGESAFGRDGNLITGSMLDYNDFDTFIIDHYNESSSNSSDSKDFYLPAWNGLGGRPIRWIQLYYNHGNISTSSTSTQRDYIAALTYTLDKVLKISTSAKFMASTIRVARSSSIATARGTVYGSSYFSLVNADQLASGGALIRISSNVGVYFKASSTYYLMIGG